jgi:cation diffusion facilitator CzcD-associated flavoprotein CzcO
MIGRRGLDVLVIERGDGIAAKWRHSYDRLAINTSSWFSYLPGYRLFRRYGQRWPTRDRLVAYYEEYAEHHDLKVQLNTEATRIERGTDGWSVHTTQGPIDCSYVVIATAKDHTPVIPSWPGSETYTGELIHSADYQNASRFRDQRVLVVGAGNSGSDIALDLLEGGARVQVAIRTPPHIAKRSSLGIPNDAFAVAMRHVPPPIVDRLARALRRVSLGDLSPYGLPMPEEGVASRVLRTGTIPTVDSGFVAAVKTRRIEVVAAVDGFSEREVILADGSRVTANAVIAASGYSADLEPLVGHLGVLKQNGRPKFHDSETHPDAPGMYFIGFTNPLSGNLRQLRFDAKRIARAIAQADHSAR